MKNMKQRFSIVIESCDAGDPMPRLRRLLKGLLRIWKFRCVEVWETTATTVTCHDVNEVRPHGDMSREFPDITGKEPGKVLGCRNSRKVRAETLKVGRLGLDCGSCS